MAVRVCIRNVKSARNGSTWLRLGGQTQYWVRIAQYWLRSARRICIMIQTPYRITRRSETQTMPRRCPVIQILELFLEIRWASWYASWMGIIKIVGRRAAILAPGAKISKLYEWNRLVRLHHWRVDFLRNPFFLPW